MYKLNGTRRSELAALAERTTTAAEALEEHLRPLYAVASKLIEEGHSATAARMTEPFKKMLHEWELYKENNLNDLERLGVSGLIQHTKHVKGLLATLTSIQGVIDFETPDTGEEVALRKSIGELFSETLCERNALTKLFQQAIPVIDRKDPSILNDAAIAFEAFNSIEIYGRVHSFRQLEKLVQRMRDAKHLIDRCAQRVTNYLPFFPE